MSGEKNDLIEHSARQGLSNRTCLYGAPSARWPLPALPSLSSFPSCWKASSSLWRKRPQSKPICSCKSCNAVMVFLTSPEGIKALSAASGDAELLVRLGGCNRRLHQSVAMVQKSLEKLSPSMNFRQIAFGQAAARICSCATGNHIYFGYGGGTSVRKEMGPVLKASAKLLARFEDAKIHIDAHAGVKAPGRFVAKNCSQARAKAILRELVHFGVPANRITFVAWGKEISSHWKDTDEKVARAEIYFQMAGAEFPERPGYYLQAALSTSTALRHGPDEMDDDFGIENFLHSDPDSLMLFLPAATGFQLVSVLNSA